jgi:plasmid stabilization system protein ParE
MTLYQVELSASAKEDIEDIALYTFEQYGLNKQMT